MKDIYRRERGVSRAAGRGQAAVEYIMSTLMILVLFTGMYGFLQQQTRRLFTAAARAIVRSYHE